MQKRQVRISGVMFLSCFAILFFLFIEELGAIEKPCHLTTFQESPCPLFFFFFFLNLFIFGCFGSLLLCAGFLQLRSEQGLLLVAVCGLLIVVAALCCGARALGMWAAVVVTRGLSSCSSRTPERRLGSCGAQAQLLCGMWDLPGPGLEPVSPALAGGFLTTVPPGKPLH